MFEEMSINGFLEDLASDSPAPGGGAAAALTGALGAGLIGMVCSLTVGKKGYEDYEAEIRAVQSEAAGLQTRLSSLMKEDAAAFNYLMSTFKLPKDTEIQQAERLQTIQQAYCMAAGVPLEIAGASLEVVRLACQIVGRSNINVLSDVEVAVELGAAGMETGLINVRVNLPYIKDPQFVAAQEQKIDVMKEKLSGYINVFNERVRKLK